VIEQLKANLETVQLEKAHNLSEYNVKITKCNATISEL
jgi:hypothetical protein